MGFKKEKQDFKVDAVVFSKEDLKQLEGMIKSYGGRYKLLEANHAIRYGKDGEMFVMELVGAIGRNSGLGSHKYDTSYIYSWWQEAFRQLDEVLHKREWAERERIFQLTGEYPKRRTLADVKLLQVPAHG